MEETIDLDLVLLVLWISSSKAGWVDKRVWKYWDDIQSMAIDLARYGGTVSKV